MRYWESRTALENGVSLPEWYVRDVQERVISVATYMYEFISISVNNHLRTRK